MKILVSLNLVLVLGALGAILLIRRHQILVYHGADSLVHWSPVRSDVESVVLPLDNSHAALDYLLWIESPAPQEIISALQDGLYVRGENRAGELTDVLMSDITIDPNSNDIMAVIHIPSNGVQYVSITLAPDLRNKVDIVGVSASTTDIKAASVAASITRHASNILTILLLVLFVSEIVVLSALIGRPHRPSMSQLAQI